MTTRVEQHRTGDLAEHAVRGVFLRAGQAVGYAPGPDYGEDLLVQIALGDRLNHARLWVQVKGNRDRRRRRVSADTEQMLRWSHSADPVAMVLWNVVDDVGWFKVLRMGPHPSQQGIGEVVRFRPQDIFDERGAKTLVALAIVSHDARQLLYTATVISGLSRGRPLDRQACFGLLLDDVCHAWLSNHQRGLRMPRGRRRCARIH